MTMKKVLSLALILTFTTITFGQTAAAESTAKAFYSAWKAKDKAKIAKLSTAKVKRLPNIKNPPTAKDGYRFEDCNEDNGVFYCRWREKDAEWMGVLLTLKKFGNSFKIINLQEGEFELMGENRE
jgi:hypothetical protein